MPVPGENTVSASVRPHVAVGAPAFNSTAVYQCLIVSPDDRTRSAFVEAVTSGGWKTLACADSDEAKRFIDRVAVHLAIVDLRGRQLETFRGLLVQLTDSTGLLVIVCGNEDATEEEIWVRQHGAWLYLPGKVASNDLTLLCVEARDIADRLNPHLAERRLRVDAEDAPWLRS